MAYGSMIEHQAYYKSINFKPDLQRILKVIYHPL